MKIKPSNIPLFSICGNKDNEMQTIIQNLPNMNDIDIIIEPYCGSFSLTRHLLLLYPNKQYICNDNDESMIQSYKELQDDDKCKVLINFFKDFEIQDKHHYDTFKKEKTIQSHIFTNIIYRIRNGMYDCKKHKFNDRDINRLIHFNKAYKNIEFICGDASIIIDKYKNNDKAFIFLDPPFLLTCSFYSNPSLDAYFELLKNIQNIKCKFLGVGGDHYLCICFYSFYNIPVIFKTSINYRGNTKKHHDNIYVGNY